MDELENLVGSDELSLDTLSEPVDTAPIVNKASNRNLAAHLAVLSPDVNSVETYRQINAELDQEAQSLTADKMVNDIRASESQITATALSEFLVDPTYDDATKQKIAKDFLDKESKRYNVRNTLSQKVLAEPIEENEEQAAVRLNVGAWIDEVNSFKKKEQALVNAEIMKSDASTSAAFMDIAQYLTPYMESAMVGKLVKDFRSMQETGEDATGIAADAMVLLGSAKMEIVEALKKMPVEERHKVKIALADLIRTNSSIVLADENDFAKSQFLNTFISEDYSETEKWVDNVTSILDMTGLGGALSRLLKSVSQSGKGAKAASAAEKARSVKGEYVPKDRVDPTMGGEQPREGKTYQEKFNWTQEDAPKKQSTKARQTSTVEGEYYEVFEGDWEEVVPTDLKAPGTGVRATNTIEGESRQVFEGDWQPYEGTGVKTPGTGMRTTNTYEGEFETVEEAMNLSANKLIRSNVQPVSVAENVKEVNPRKAAQIHAAAIADESGEVAEAMYGTSRTEAVANDLAPQMGNTLDITEHKPGRIAETSAKMLDPSEDIKNFMDMRGFIWASDVEKEAARATAWNDFRNVKGVTFRTNMSSLKVDTDTGAIFNGIYGPDNGGYRNAVEGVNHVLYSLRDFGVTPKDITLLERTPKGYRPVNLKLAPKLAEGDYLVQVKYNWEMKPLDITSPEQWTMKRNLFDSFAGSVAAHQTMGTLSRNIFDPASMLDPRMMKSAYVAVDKASRLEQILLDKGEKFAKALKDLPKARVDGVMDYLKEANYKGLKFSPSDLRSRGFTDDEIEVVRLWRNAWDELYWLENDDVRQTLSKRGYRMLIDPVNGDKLVGRPLARNMLKEIEPSDLVYDPAAQMQAPRSYNDLQAMYDKGEVVLQLRTPIHQNGDIIRFVISKEQPGATYTRALNKSDQILPYREGYYKVNYKAPQFIVERVKDARGKVIYERAVSTAGTRADAIVEAERLARVNGKSFDKTGMLTQADYYVRGDAKGDQLTDFNFDVFNASGRSSQRYRGQRLNEANAPSYNGANHSYIENPAEALISASRNIARRVPMREWLDAMKARFNVQYKDVIGKDKYGRPHYPDSIEDINKKGRGTDKDVRDARTAYAYIQEMENGYINQIDAAYKAVLNMLADKLGDAGKGKSEKAVRVIQESRGPVEFSKNLAFHAYLVGHPLRQALIQAHQAVLYMPINPKYFSQVPYDVTGLLLALHGLTDIKTAAKASRRSQQEFSDMLNDLVNSGLIASIDKQNLVRSSLSSLADELDKFGPYRALASAMTYARKIGFDLGESVNMMIAFNVYRDKALREGRVLTPAVLEEVAAEARNLSLGMNRAGDMPYNQNALGMMFQFMQAPHKMMLLAMTNRVLPRRTRLTLAGYTLAMWTLPAGTMYSLLDATDTMPENEEARKLVVEGVEAYFINTAIQAATGSSTRLDLSSLSPFDPYGMGEFVLQMFSEGPLEIITKSPVGQLFFGNNPKITDAFRTTGQWIMGDSSYSVDEKTYADVLKSAASVFSGADAGFKAAYIMEHGKRLSYNGAESGDLDSIAAIGQLFGFQTMEDVERAYLKQKAFKANERLKKDVKTYYDQLKRLIADEGISNKDQQFIRKVLGSGYDYIYQEYGVEGKKELFNLLEWDLKNNDDALVLRILKRSNMRDNQNIKRDLEMIKDWDEEKRKRFFEQLIGVDEAAAEEDN